MGKVDSSTILAKIDSDADSTSRFTVIDKPIRGILMLVMMIMSVILEKQYEKPRGVVHAQSTPTLRAPMQ